MAWSCAIDRVAVLLSKTELNLSLSRSEIYPLRITPTKDGIDLNGDQEMPILGILEAAP